MKIETELLLQEFRDEQSELFNEEGVAYSRLSHKEPMNRMLILINALNNELSQSNDFRYCMPDEVNSKEDHKEYLKAIGFNLLHEFFNHKSDANKYLEAMEQEDLEKEFGEWYFQNAL